jgi:triosephosphate isomerase (TIM)
VQLPRIVVNAKAYPESTGPELALALAAAANRAARRADEPVGWCAAATDLAILARKAHSHLVLMAQHVDPAPPGAATGWVTAEMLALAGARGTLLNHAERKLPAATLAESTDRAKKAGLLTLVCADSLAEARSAAALRPTAIAVEPPELIGGDVSVTTADPAIVRDAAAAVRKVAPRCQVLCGAGVKTAEDVRAAFGLGAHGVLLASGVVKARDPGAALRGLLEGLPG